MQSTTEVIPLVFLSLLVRPFRLLPLIFKCEGRLNTFKDRTKGNKQSEAENSQFIPIALSA